MGDYDQTGGATGYTPSNAPKSVGFNYQDRMQLVKLTERMKALTDKAEELDKTLHQNYVTRTEFAPIKSIVYGGVGLVLATIVGATLTIILRSP